MGSNFLINLFEIIQYKLVIYLKFNDDYDDDDEDDNDNSDNKKNCN